MRRLVLVAVALLSSTAAFAASTTHSYLIGTKHPAAVSVARMHGDDSPVGRNVETFGIVDAYRADLTDDEAIALRNSAEVRYVEPDIEHHAFGLPSSPASNQLRNTVGQTLPYGVKMIDAPTVWKTTRGDAINVAVLDTGIDLTHPDLQSAYAGGFNTYFGDKAFPKETSDPIDDEGHGTHVAGTIAATDNNIGVVGVAPGVRLYSVRVLHSDGNGSATGPTSKIVAGIQWVVQQKQAKGGNWIISMSLGACAPSTTEGNAIANAINAGILVVAASGNHDSTTAATACTGSSDDNVYGVSYPAAFPGVIAVAAVDSAVNIADFSNFGPEVSIAGPGVSVLSTVILGTGTVAAVSTSNGKTFTANALTGSPFGTLTGTFVDCGLGATASDFPASVSGNIALIKRGDVTFATKVKNAQAAGATAVIIYNKDASDLSFTLTADPADDGHVWPITVAVSLNDGLALLASHASSVTIAATKDDYANYSGTSMATPHVAAAAALVWSAVPSASAATIRDALLTTASDFGTPGFDNLFGNGLVNPFAAGRKLNPAAFPLPSVGRAPGRRGH
ncbi:MAG TPA: S8 family serine peptidase [Thermoanaerobaculia bacterium]|nr:S8 family serine peptidase [Thermoanaerobaculia bacterium]